MRALLITLAAIALGGCALRHGPRAETLAVAQSARGLEASLRIGKTWFSGELMAIADTVVVLDSGKEVLHVPLSRVSEARFRDTSDDKFREHYEGPLLRSPAAQKRLRLLSRFPHGLTPEVEAKLLAAHGQTAVRLVGS